MSNTQKTEKHSSPFMFNPLLPAGQWELKFDTEDALLVFTRGELYYFSYIDVQGQQCTMAPTYKHGEYCLQMHMPPPLHSVPPPA